MSGAMLRRHARAQVPRLFRPPLPPPLSALALAVVLDLLPWRVEAARTTELPGAAIWPVRSRLPSVSGRATWARVMMKRIARTSGSGGCGLSNEGQRERGRALPYAMLWTVGGFSCTYRICAYTRLRCSRL